MSGETDSAPPLESSEGPNYLHTAGARPSLLVLGAALLIQGLCLLGFLASDIVPFTTKVPLTDAIGRVVHELPDAIQHRFYPVLILLLLIGFAIALAYSLSRSRRWRLILAVAAILLPIVLSLKSDRAVALLGISVVMAFPFTTEMLLSPMDGEDWEGVPFAAIGWWLMLWGVVILREMLHPPHHDRRGFPVVGRAKHR